MVISANLIAPNVAGVAVNAGIYVLQSHPRTNVE